VSVLLDHLFIVTVAGAPEAEALLALGLSEGSAGTHAGQGTANRRFFFHNAMLELVYVRDRDEALHGSGKRLRVLERGEVEGASPIGIVLRPARRSAERPFGGWRYHADYLAPDDFFLIGENSDVLEEPLCVVMPGGLSRPIGQPLSPEPFTVVTGVRVGVPVDRPSGVLETVGAINGISVSSGVPHCLEVEFNGGIRESKKDFRPALPLVIHW